MTAISGVRAPSVPASATKENTSPRKSIALAGIAAISTIGGGVIGSFRGSPLKGLAVGAAVGAVALGAALLGMNGRSTRDGWCDYPLDPDCDYPVVDPMPGPYDYYPPHRYDQFDPAPRLPTSPGDDY